MTPSSSCSKQQTKAQTQAQDAIDEAAAAGGDKNKIDKALDEMAKMQ